MLNEKGREIVTIQLGQCGNQVGGRFWNLIANEHGVAPSGIWEGVSPLQKQRLDVYFDETPSGKFKARAILCDLEAGPVDGVLSSRYGRLFKSDCAIIGSGGASNNWATGSQTGGLEVIDQLMDAIRRKVEISDSPQGFQMVHSLGGGSGSGLGSLVTEKLSNEYADIIRFSYAVIPAPSASNTVLEAYNTLLSLPASIDNHDGCILLDNEALSLICDRLGLKRASFGDMNHLIAAGMSGISCSMRFPGQLNCDLRKLCTNMVPFPRLHFFATSFAPLLRRGIDLKNVGITEITSQMFTPDNLYVATDPTRGKYLTASAIYRGKFSMKDVDENIFMVQSQNAGHFVDFIPYNIKTAVCDIPPLGMKLSATFLGNTTAIQMVFDRIRRQYRKMASKGAYIHWYLMEGMEESEFSEAEANITDLIAEYQQFENALDGPRESSVASSRS